MIHISIYYTKESIVHILWGVLVQAFRQKPMVKNGKNRIANVVVTTRNTIDKSLDVGYLFCRLEDKIADLKEFSSLVSYERLFTINNSEFECVYKLNLLVVRCEQVKK